MAVSRWSLSISVTCLLAVDLCSGSGCQDGGIPLQDKFSNLVVGMESKVTDDTSGAIKLECDQNMSLRAHEAFRWYASSSDADVIPLTDENYIHYKPGYREIILIPSDLQYHYIIFCVDPVTNNTAKAYRFYNGTEFKSIYHHEEFRTTQCALSDGFITLLSCRDMYIPPVSSPRCVWQYRRFRGDDWTILNNSKNSDLKILADNSTQEGYHKCQCDAKGTIVEMTHVVPRVVSGNKTDRDVANYTFCVHVPISIEDETEKDVSYDTFVAVQEKLASTQKELDNCQTHKYSDGVTVTFIVITVVEFGVIVGVPLARYTRRRYRKRRDFSTQNDPNNVPLHGI